MLSGQAVESISPLMTYGVMGATVNLVQLFDSDSLGQVSWLIDIGFPQDVWRESTTVNLVQLFDSDSLGQVSRLIDIGFPQDLWRAGHDGSIL